MTTAPDPFRPRSTPGDADARTAATLGDLDRRVRALENRTPVSDTFTGAPSAARPPGVLGVQTDTPRLWVRVAGTWTYVALSS